MGFGKSSLEFLGLKSNYKKFMQEKICSKGYENSENIGEVRQECLDEYKIAGGTCAGENDINNVSFLTCC